MLDRLEKLAVILILLSAALWAPEVKRLADRLVQTPELEQRVRQLEQKIERAAD